MTKLNTLQRLLLVSDLYSELISNRDVMMKIAIYLNAPIYHFTGKLYFLAKSFCPPSERGRITHVSFSDEVIQLICVKW